MVRLNRIYTKTGDGGATGLGDGTRVAKDDPRVEAYGCVDEANSALGVAVAAAGTGVLAGLMQGLQHDLFDVGADLCRPIKGPEAAGSVLRITPAQTRRLEEAIDEYNDALKPLESFVLPGGTALAAALHVARAAARHAERRVVALHAARPAETNPETITYLNRLSDLLFVLARVANTPAHGGGGDVLWVPGANRGKP